MTRTQNNGGYILVWLAAGLTMFGLLGSWHGLMLAAAGRTTRAFDAWRQSVAEAQRIEQAITEAALSDGELEEEGRIPADSIQQHLRRLDAGGAELTVETAPDAWPWRKPFPFFDTTPAPLVAPSPTLQSTVPAEMARWLGSKVETHPAILVTTRSRRILQGQIRLQKYDTQLTLVSVPLSRFGLAAYELPSALGLQTGSRPTKQAKSAMPPGLVPLRDEACCGDWLPGENTLPYFHRRRASIAAAYRNLFSKATADHLAEIAGATHFHDLDQSDAAATAALGGLQRNAEGASWDLGIAGRGRFGSEEKQNTVAVVTTRSSGRKLILHDSVGNLDAGALVIVLFGPGPIQTGYLEVQLETIVRPVMIIGYNIRLVGTAGASIRGAVFLDSASTFGTSNGEWRVSHLSYPAANDVVSETAKINTDGDLPAVLESWIPRVRYVAATTTRKDP